MTRKEIYGITAAILGIALTAMLMVFSVNQTHANILGTGNVVTPNSYQYYTFFASSTVPSATAATSTTATSTNITGYIDANGVFDHGYMVIAGAKKVTFFFTVGGTYGAITSATSTYSVQVSPDGVNWYNYSKLLQATSTSISATIAQSSIQVVDPTSNTATSTAIYSMDLTTEGYLDARCIATPVGTGVGAQCAAFATY